MNKKLLLFLLIIFIAIFSVACAMDIEYAKPHVVSIAVNGISKVDDYIVGDNVDISGAFVVAVYSDGNLEEVALEYTMLDTDSFDMLIPEVNKKITVVYKGAKAEFFITVLDVNFESISLLSIPTKTTYIEGENILTDGAYIGVHYSGGKTVRIAVTSNMLQHYNNLLLGQQQILISYFNKTLTFSVNYLPKTVKKIEVMREPYQNTVFKNFGDRLDLDGMRLKLSYDNGLTPNVYVSDILDSVKVYFDDSETGTVFANVIYLPTDYATEIEYEYLGKAIVNVGDYVYPDKEIASNLVLEDTLSKTYGVVLSTANNKVIVSTIVSYNVTQTTLRVGQIVLNDDIIGKYGNANIKCDGGGGIVQSIGDGKVVIQTAPTNKFSLNIKDRAFDRMEILTYPKTNKYETPTQTETIIQGDTLNLSTGRVRVYFDNGESVDLAMDNTLIKVTNDTETAQRREIKNLTFENIDNVEGVKVESGGYQLLYKINHSYDKDGISINVSVVDEEGNYLLVRDNLHVSLEKKKNYTVSITVTRHEEGRTLVSECSYYLSTEGAAKRQQQLDISAAGIQNLLIIYSGVATNNLKFNVTVVQKQPIRLEIRQETNNIHNHVFYLGDTISLSLLEYKIVYDNGDESAWTGVTRNMLSEGSSLVCDTLTNNKEIVFSLASIGMPNVTSTTLICSVEPQPIQNLTFKTQPYNNYLTAPGGAGNHIDLSGGVLSVYYKNGTVATVGNAFMPLQQLLNNSGLPRITIDYGENPPSDAYSPESINNKEVEPYIAILTYTNEYGVEKQIDLPYYIYYVSGNRTIAEITADYREGLYKKEYIQCEDWDLSGIKLVVKYSDGSQSTVDAHKSMIYDTTTDYVANDVAVKFIYMGKIYEGALKINISPRMEETITVTIKGKSTYLVTDRNIDLSAYTFAIKYNAGPNETINGVVNFDGSASTAGWWYQILDKDYNYTVLNREGTKYIRLYYTTLKDSAYHTIYCDIEIEVFANNSTVVSIEYIPDAADSFYGELYNGLPIFAEVIQGLPIVFADYDQTSKRVFYKYLTVNYADGTKGYVNFTSEMLNYSQSHLTPGYRSVEISYKDAKCTVYIIVRVATLDKMEVEQKPITNFIAGSNLNLVGGILKLTYKGTVSGVSVNIYKYIDMDSEEIERSGFNSNIDLAKNHEEQTINLTYREKNIDYTTSYNIVVYNKQNVVFEYQNTIFFYGRTSEASVTSLRAVPEFELPSSSNIEKFYVSNQYFMEEGDVVAYLIANPDRAINNILKVIVGYTENGADIYKYVDEKYASSTHFYAPATVGYDYFILMKVQGNIYYKDGNYCLTKYKIIPKIISVSAINASEHAYIYRIKTQDMPSTVSYLYELNFSEIRNQFSEHSFITGLEMASPNKDYVEILLSVNNTYTETEQSYNTVKSVFVHIKNMIEQNVKIRNSESYVNVSSYDTVSEDGITKGVNVSEFEGGKPSFISYRLERGETLRLSGVLDLLENSLGLNIIENDFYRVGTFRTTTGNLSHNNYTLDFVSSDYIIKHRKISSYIFVQGTTSGSIENENLVLNITTSQSLNLILMYVNSINSKVSETILANDYKVEYYLGAEKLEAVPKTVGTYTVKILDAYQDALGQPMLFNFTMIIS